MYIIPSAVSDSVFRYAGMPREGFVHSVYRNTVNIILGERLIALQSAGSPRSALSVILPADTSEMESIAPIPGASCCVRDGLLLFESADSMPLRIPVGAPALPESLLYPSGIPLLPERSSWIPFIRESAFGMFRNADGFAGIFREGRDDDPVLSYAGKVLDSASEALKDGDLSSASGQLCRLIGLGGGLTPSGDDFLCGMLSLLYSVNAPFFDVLSEDVTAHLADTNAISAAFLDRAVQGECSEAVRELFLTELPCSEFAAAKLRAGFEAIGHTSGMDSLCGIWYAAGLLTYAAALPG